MAIWELSNLVKKEAVERQFWVKDDITVIKDEGFRWGKWTIESDEMPNVDLDNKEGWEQNSQEQDWQLEEMFDGSWVDWTFPDDMDEEERERIENLWNEEYFEGLEGDGWVNDETEFWVHGPLLLKNLDTGEEFRGSDEN